MATVKQCDRCGSVKDVEPMRFYMGRAADGAGGSMDVVEEADLCFKCQGRVLKALCRDEAFSREAGAYICNMKERRHE